MIVVDDEAEAIARYFDAYAGKPEALPCLGSSEYSFAEENAEWRASAQGAWTGLSSPERRNILSTARKILDEINPTRGLTHLEAIEQIFPTGTVTLITPEAWQEENETLTEGPNAPIVLFDQQLGSFGHTGMELLEAYRASRPEADPPAGILSNEITEDGALMSLSEADRARVPVASLMFISKLHLRDGHYYEAVSLFRLTANMQHLNAARDSVVDGLLEDLETAVNDTRALSPRVLEDVVYRSSGVEGAWEGETLARIAGLYVVRATRKREIDNDLRAIVSRARKLSRWVQESDDTTASSEAAEELHRIENFAPGTWVNALQLPPANGDIFEIAHGETASATTQCFVLVGQPCDLFVRPDGEREARDVRLLPIRPETTRARETLLEQPLPMAPPTALPPCGAVLLKKGFNVNVDVLDLCWLNESGLAQVDVDTADDDLMLTEGLTLRRKALITRCGDALDHLAIIGRISKKRLDAGVSLHTAGEIRLDYDPQAPRRWQYPIQRVARMAPRQSEALLVRFAAAQARAAFDHDLSSFTQSSS